MPNYNNDPIVTRQSTGHQNVISTDAKVPILGNYRTSPVLFAIFVRCLDFSSFSILDYKVGWKVDASRCDHNKNRLDAGVGGCPERKKEVYQIGRKAKNNSRLIWPSFARIHGVTLYRR